MDSATHNSESLSVIVCRDIVRAAAALRKYADADLGPAGLSGPQFGILRQLELAGAMPLSELGRRLWVTCGNVTGLVDRLVAAGHVRRTRDDVDRRVVLAELTDQGREIVGRLTPVVLDRLTQFTSALTETQLHELQVLLEKICCNAQPEGK